MNSIIFVTVLFWNTEATPLKLELTTSYKHCSPEVVKEYTAPLRVLEGWKMMISQCKENLG